MNRKLMILAVTGAVVLAGCARMMADKPPGEPMRASSQMAAPQEEAAKPQPPKAQPKPKAKPVPRTSQPRR